MRRRSYGQLSLNPIPITNDTHRMDLLEMRHSDLGPIDHFRFQEKLNFVLIRLFSRYTGYHDLGRPFEELHPVRRQMPENHALHY